MYEYGDDGDDMQGVISSPPQCTYANARAEAEEVLGDVFQRVLDKCHIDKKDVKILISNCSLFTPTPSLTSMVCASS